MEVKNLRIGNLIKSKLLESNHKVTGFIKKNGKEFIYTDLQESNSELDDWEGIEINCDSLILLNFKERENQDNVYYFQIKNLIVAIYLLKKIRIHFIFTTGDNRLMIDNCKYIHELQNLFFAIKKQELPIGFIISADGNLIPINQGLHNYIMTESGRTFERVNKAMTKQRISK